MKTGFLILLVFFSHRAFPQDHQLDKQLAELTNDIRQYEEDYKTLAVHRGISYLEGSFSAAKLRQAISTYALSGFDEEVKQFKFLFYHYRKDTMHIWLFSCKGMVEVMKKIPLVPDSLLALENTLKQGIKVQNMLASNRGLYEATEKKYRLTREQSIDYLTRMLLPKQVVDKLAGTRYLCILPNLNISSIPFGMLKPWNNDASIIDSMSYSFVHNLREFFDTIDEDKSTGKETDAVRGRYKLINPLIVGNPRFADGCTDGLPTLMGAEKEAEAVAAQLQVTPYLGEHAIKKEIMEKMKSSTFIYLATHGYSDATDVMNKSFIALYEPGGCGYLTPVEIQKMHLLETSIVILSACETGRGRILDAGVIGLARGFLKASAKSVIMSLWNVDDEQTRRLMLIFMEELNKVSAFFPAENFRKAVLRYKIELNDDPIYWAAFQNFGTPMRFTFKNSLLKNALND